MNEEWLPVVGYENCYEVSDLGRVRSLDRVVPSSNNQKQRRRGRLLKILFESGEYPRACLCVDQKKVNICVHRLVCAAFIGPKPEGFVTRHLDGDPANNKLSNLAYGTYKDNKDDELRHGHRMRGDTHHQAKLTKEDVLAIRASSDSGKALASFYKVTNTSISRIRLRQTWAHV